MGVCLLSSFLLFKTKYVRYLNAFWCMSFMRLFMLDFGIFSFVGLSMECSCMAPLTPVAMVMRGWCSIRCFGWCHLVGHTWRVYV